MTKTAIRNAATVASTPRLRMAQRLHAAIVQGVPALSLFVVAYECVRGHVEAWHIALLATTYMVTMLGITVGFHRLLTHRAFKTSGFVRALFTIAGSMAGQGPAMYWVCNHRLHHADSDGSGDPHSPHVDQHGPLSTLRGLWHAHAGWSYEHDLANPVRLAPDLLADPLFRSVNKHYILWMVISLVVPTLCGAAITHTWHGAFEGLLWGGLLRLFLNFHLTCCINSLTHWAGSKTYATGDESRNNLWVAIPTLGEGWHNNHHAFPSSAFIGLRWWEIDIGAWLVSVLSVTKLVWDVQRPSKQARARRAIGASEVEP
jgi:stearoyl-CoA desaturase (Delta-9 desaturase)